MEHLTIIANRYNFTFILNPVLYWNVKPVFKTVQQIEEIIKFLESINLNMEVILWIYQQMN